MQIAAAHRLYKYQYIPATQPTAAKNIFGKVNEKALAWVSCTRFLGSNARWYVGRRMATGTTHKPQCMLSALSLCITCHFQLTSYKLYTRSAAQDTAYTTQISLAALSQSRPAHSHCA